MLTRSHGKIEVQCDACGEVLDTETRDFDEARACWKSEMWDSRKIGNVWCHYCTNCADAE